MAEYIDIDTPLELKVAWGNTYKPYTSTLRELLDTNRIPYTTADVVPVVRCDDCINFTCGENESERWEWCILWGHDVSHGNYCSYGTKMDKDGSE